MCTFHNGQAEPKRANCSLVAEWRLVMLPAWSTRAKKKGHALQPRPLQRRQAVGDLLDRGAEAFGQQFQIMAQLARGLQEGAVGQHRRAGEIIGEADAADGLGVFRAEFGLFHDLVDGVGMGGQRDLMGDLGRRASPTRSAD